MTLQLFINKNNKWGFFLLWEGSCKRALYLKRVEKMGSKEKLASSSVAKIWLLESMQTMRLTCGCHQSALQHCRHVIKATYQIWTKLGVTCCHRNHLSVSSASCKCVLIWQQVLSFAKNNKVNPFLKERVFYVYTQKNGILTPACFCFLFLSKTVFSVNNSITHCKRDEKAVVSLAFNTPQCPQTTSQSTNLPKTEKQSEPEKRRITGH